MVDKAPGWYPDPQGERQVRFWDGSDWTEYVQPFAPPEAIKRGALTAVEDYPYLANAALRTPAEPRTVQTWITPAAPVAVMETTAVARSHRGGLGWWIAGGGLLVAVVVVALVTSLLRDDNDTPVLVDPSPSATASVDAAVVTPGSAANGSVPDGGELHTTIDIADQGVYFVSVTSTADTALEVSQGGTAVFASDDRRDVLADVVGGLWSDPGAFVELAPGTYDAVITNRDAGIADVEVSVEAVDVSAVEIGVATTVDIPVDGWSLISVPVATAGTLTVDVRGSGPADDPRLTHFINAVPTSVDDRTAQQAVDLGGSEYDPYLISAVDPGNVLILLDEYERTAITVTVTASLS